MKPSINFFAGLALLLLLLLLAAGCSERDTTVPTQPEAGQTTAGTTSQAAAVLPGQGTVQIVPAAPTTLDDLRAVASGVSGKLTYRWEVNGSAVTEATAARLPHGFFSKDDRVGLILTVNGHELGAETFIRNTPPEVVSVSLSPQGFYHGIDLTSSAQGRDADGDDITYTYTWLINDDEQLFENSATLPSILFQRDDRIALVVTPSDGEDVGQPFRTGELVVANAPPYFVSLPPVLEPESVTYRYAVRAVDPDNDPLAYSLEMAPVGMTIDKKSGMLNWQMDGSLAGEHEVVILVTDPHGAQNVQTFNINLTYAE